MMRRELAWALAACLALSAWALLNPVSKPESGAIVSAIAPPSVAAEKRTGSATGEVADSASARRANAAELPAAWPTPELAAADRSPFAAQVPPPVAKPAASALAASPPPAAAPVVAYRFWGGLTTPSGERLLYVARDDNQSQPVPVQVGTRLEGGFQVEQIGAGAIVLAQSGSQRRVTLSMSPPAAVGVH